MPVVQKPSKQNDELACQPLPEPKHWNLAPYSNIPQAHPSRFKRRTMSSFYSIMPLIWVKVMERCWKGSGQVIMASGVQQNHKDWVWGMTFWMTTSAFGTSKNTTIWVGSILSSYLPLSYAMQVWHWWNAIRLPWLREIARVKPTADSQSCCQVWWLLSGKICVPHGMRIPFQSMCQIHSLLQALVCVFCGVQMPTATDNFFYSRYQPSEHQKKISGGGGACKAYPSCT